MPQSRLLDAVDTALAILPQNACIAVAYSGGLDSTVLLALCREIALTRQLKLYALHVNHGLQSAADDWQRFCHRQAQTMGIEFHSGKVNVDIGDGDGIEAAARRARYIALAKWCDMLRIDALLLAHHQDDQAETLLLNLLRGSGVAGLAAMAIDGPPPWMRNVPAAAAGPFVLHCLRPLLHLPQSLLRDYAQQHRLAYVQDPSNVDTRLRRNALRHRLLPVLRHIEPAASVNLARSARHLAEAQQLLDELGQTDIAPLVSPCHDGMHDSLASAPLLALGQVRARNALRVWLRSLGLRAPSEARLAALIQQLYRASSDRQLLWRHEGFGFRTWRGRLWCDAVGDGQTLPAMENQKSILSWHGQANWTLPHWYGTLHFIPADKAGANTVPESMLRATPIIARPRQGGERLRLATNRPSRPLKQVYQEMGIPPWRRTGPLFWLADQLLMAPELGVDAQWCNTLPNDPLRRLVWEKERSC